MYKNSFFETLQVKLHRFRFLIGAKIYNFCHGIARYYKRRRILADCPDENSRKQTLERFADVDRKVKEQDDRKVYYAKQATEGIRAMLDAVTFNTADPELIKSLGITKQSIEDDFERGKSKATMYLGWMTITLPEKKRANIERCIEMIESLKLEDFKSSEEAHTFAKDFIRVLLLKL